ncbi:MAG TPA: DNA methyltransferase [Candidatus Marinimicrobia bacterium]|nr:DNA methyltransferase [Candidatus Neomarinimicrobiota bacterium]
MNKEQKFYQALQDVFIGAKIEGVGGFVNLMRIKSNYYRRIEDLLKKDIENALKNYPSFRDELFDKLYSFFSRYFTESGSIYFNQTPFHNNIYEKVYTDEKDVILFWKTQMLYYVKTDRIFRSLPVEFPAYAEASAGRDGFKFYFDASKIESKKANEKRSLVFELAQVKEDQTIVFNVLYSEKGTKTKQDEILKAIMKNGIAITEEQLERAFRVFEKQSEVDFFINKNAKAFLQEQFKLWSYQYFWEGAKEWSTDRVNELQILKDIAFKIIDFIAQFEDELVKIWNKPKFVKNSNYVITLDRIWNNSPSAKGWQAKPDGVVKWYELPYNPSLKERAKELRKAGNLSEVLFWNQVKNKQFLGLDFDRQKIVGNYIVDFYCKNLGIVIEIDGESHNDKIDYDKERDQYLRGLGLKVIHIFDIDIKKNLNDVMEFLKQEFNNAIYDKDHSAQEATPRQTTSDTPLLEGNTPRPSDTNPLEENVVEKILNHPNIQQQIKEWQELGIVNENFKIEDVFETDLTGKHLSTKYEHLPIDTRYFKDLELEILSRFDDLDNSLDGWLIKSENYQALNTILPKFKEKVQTIYIDPPFNTGDDFPYVDRFQDSSWLSLMKDRINAGLGLLKKDGTYWLHMDDNANVFAKELIKEKFSQITEVIFDTNATRDIEADLFGYKSFGDNFQLKHQTLFYCRNEDYLFRKLWKPNRNETNLNIGWMDLIAFPKTSSPKKISDFIFKIEKWINGTFGMQEINVDEKVFPVGDIWNDIFSFTQSEMRVSESFSFTSSQKPENLLRRIIQSSSEPRSIVLDYFLGIGTTTAVAHKLNRKWVGIEMGSHFEEIYYSEGVKKLGVKGRMKLVLSGDKNINFGELERRPHLSKDIDWQGGGFFKYYELEQYEEALANCKHDDGDLFTVQGRSPYQEYVFMKDEKMLKALEIDYESNKVKVDLDKLYPNIDIAETLSNLTGKWIKKIEADKVWLNGLNEPINIKDLDYKLIKPLIWWE